MSRFQEIILRTERCELRPWRAEDAPQLPLIASTREISWNTSYKFPYPFELEDAHRYIAFNTKDAGRNSWHFAAFNDGKLIGSCGATRSEDVQSHTAVIAYWLGVDYWGRGLATEVVETFVSFMVEQTDIEQLTATGYAWNPASARVLEKCGFEREGVRKRVVKKWDKYTDLWIYGKLLR